MGPQIEEFWKNVGVNSYLACLCIALEDTPRVVQLASLTTSKMDQMFYFSVA